MSNIGQYFSLENSSHGDNKYVCGSQVFCSYVLYVENNTDPFAQKLGWYVSMWRIHHSPEAQCDM